MRIAATQISCSLGDLKANHFRTLTTARAIENHSYVIVANRIGTDEDVSFRGASTIIDPYGATIAAVCQDREQLIQAEISEVRGEICAKPDGSFRSSAVRCL
jgi:predicted amidohydrolase